MIFLYFCFLVTVFRMIVTVTRMHWHLTSTFCLRMLSSTTEKKARFTRWSAFYIHQGRYVIPSFYLFFFFMSEMVTAQTRKLWTCLPGKPRWITGWQQTSAGTRKLCLADQSLHPSSTFQFGPGIPGHWHSWGQVFPGPLFYLFIC